MQEDMCTVQYIGAHVWAFSSNDKQYTNATQCTQKKATVLYFICIGHAKVILYKYEETMNTEGFLYYLHTVQNIRTMYCTGYWYNLDYTI